MMRIPELRDWAFADEQKDSELAFAVRHLFATFDEQTKKLAKVVAENHANINAVEEVKTLRGNVKAYAAENARLRKLVEVKDPWDSQ